MLFPSVRFSPSVLLSNICPQGDSQPADGQGEALDWTVLSQALTHFWPSNLLLIYSPWTFRSSSYWWKRGQTLKHKQSIITGKKPNKQKTVGLLVYPTPSSRRCARCRATLCATGSAAAPPSPSCGSSRWRQTRKRRLETSVSCFVATGRQASLQKQNFSNSSDAETAGRNAITVVASSIWSHIVHVINH